MGTDRQVSLFIEDRQDYLATTEICCPIEEQKNRGVLGGFWIMISREFGLNSIAFRGCHAIAFRRRDGLVYRRALN
jgi:hypothetical protein